jgi:hypothetical protein
MLGRFVIVGDPSRYFSLQAAILVAQRMSRARVAGVAVMAADDDWWPTVWLGSATAGVWLDAPPPDW